MQSRRVGGRHSRTDGFVTGERDGRLDAVAGFPEANFDMTAGSLDSWGRGYTEGYRQGRDPLVQASRVLRGPGR